MMRANGWEAFHLSEAEVPSSIRLGMPIETISCYEFALMRAGVKEAFPTKWNVTMLLDLLPKWGFVQVSKKGSQPGDLALFTRDGRPTHMGIRYKQDILSKPGNEQRFSFVHTLEEAFPEYGTQVLFFRRQTLTF